MPEKWLIQASEALNKSARAAAKAAGLSLSEWIRQLAAKACGNDDLAEVPKRGRPLKKKVAKKAAKKK